MKTLEFWFQSELQEVNVAAEGSGFKVWALIYALASDREVPNALIGTQVRPEVRVPALHLSQGAIQLLPDSRRCFGLE